MTRYKKCALATLFLVLMVGELVATTVDKLAEYREQDARIRRMLKQKRSTEDSSPRDTFESMTGLEHQPHQPLHRIKRKGGRGGGSRGGGRGFGFGKSKGSKPKSNPYPKQQPHNPNYGAAPAGGAPPAYPGMGGKPAYPQQPGGAPPAYPGDRPGGYPGAPPAYPGTGYNNMNRGYPGAGGAMGGAAMGGAMGGMGGMAAGGGGFGNSFGHKSGGGIGRSMGSAGFGALAGTALGAYGGYKLGKMVGGMGHHGHYGYYNDHGRYMRCEPPAPQMLKVDPVTNVTYIPPEAGYDVKCSYFERQPPMYYTSAGMSSFSHPINTMVGAVVKMIVDGDLGAILAQLAMPLIAFL